MTADSNDVGHQLLSDEDIGNEEIKIHEVPTEEELEDEDEFSGILTPGEVQEIIDKCLLWYERLEESTYTSLLLLKQIRDLAATKRYSKLKQLKQHSFLKH